MIYKNKEFRFFIYYIRKIEKSLFMVDILAKIWYDIIL